MLGQDAYLRLHPSRSPLHSPVPELPDSLVFVDLDSDSGEESTWVSKQLRAAPPGYFLAATSVVVRWPAAEQESDDFLVEQAGGIADLLQTRVGRRVPVALARFPIGAWPELVWSSGAEEMLDRTGELLARSRAAELGALLDLGRAVWRPPAYHYRLPSGEHSSVFVRVADAIGRPRDATALVTWLLSFAAEDVGVVIDTPTLVPLVLALHARLRSEGLAPGPVSTLTDYPTNQFEVDQAVADLQGAERVLGLLSVMSTGSVGSRMATALGRQEKPWRLEVLVNRNSPGAAEMEVDREPDRVGRAAPWIGLTGEARSYRSRNECALCRSSAAARIVYIDPRSFEAMVLPEPQLLMPDVRHALDARDLWTRYDAVGGVGVQCQPHPETSELRAQRDLLAIRCYPNSLFDNVNDPANRPRADQAGFLNEVTRRSNLIAEGYRDAKGLRTWDPAECTRVVVTKSDWGSSEFKSFLAALAKGFGRDPWSDDEIVVVSKPYMDVPATALTGSPERILVVTVGTVTGSTMQQLLVGLHDITDAEIGGLVIHARPERKRDWEVLRNSYNRRLDCLWMTYLPWQSPFDGEAALLPRAADALNTMELPDELNDAALLFVTRREAITAPPAKVWTERVDRIEATDADPYGVFWGMNLSPPGPPVAGEPAWPSRAGPLLRPGSRYGQRLRAVTTYAAVAAAMQSARVEAHAVGAPVWLQFELPAILRSYFDPLIIAAILRWLEPHEAWWGARPEDSANVIAEAFARATETDRRILLPELLLAAAQGKVPNQGRDWLAGEARRCRASWQSAPPNVDPAEYWTAAELAPVVVGEALLDGPSGPDSAPERSPDSGDAGLTPT